MMSILRGKFGEVVGGKANFSREGEEEGVNLLVEVDVLPLWGTRGVGSG